MAVKSRFGNTFSSIYPAVPEVVDNLSTTSFAEEVFVGYKFCRNLQTFLLDYSFKIESQVPLSDEVKQDGYSEE